MTQYTNPPDADDHGTFAFDGVTFDVQLPNYEDESFMFNVKYPPYNATGNGTSNDTAAIQAAHDAAAVNGGVIYFPPGIYLSDPLTWNIEKVGIQGAGANVSTIRSRSAGSLFTYQAVYAGTDWLPSYGAISDITLDGNGVGTVGLDLTGIYYWRFHRVHVKSFTTGAKLRGVLLGQANQCVFDYNGTAIDAANINIAGFGNDETNMNRFLDCAFHHNTAKCVEWKSGAPIVFQGCNFENGPNAIDFYPDSGHVGVGLVVDQCFFELVSGDYMIQINAPAAANLHTVLRDLVTNFISATYGIKAVGTATNKVVAERVVIAAYPGLTNAFFATDVNVTWYLSNCVGSVGGTGTTLTAQFA